MPTIKELRKICQNPDDTNVDSSFRVKVLRFFSIYITRLLINTPITSNQISLSTIFVIIIAAFLFSTGDRILSTLAIILIFLFMVLDCVDGEVARYKKSMSVNGLFVELLPEIIFLPILYAGITIGVFRNHESLLFLIFGVSAIIFSFYNGIIQYIKHEAIFSKLIDYSQGEIPDETNEIVESTKSQKPYKNKKTPLRKLFQLVFPWIQGSSSTFIMFIAAAFNYLDVFLFIYGILLPLFTIIIIHHEIKIGTHPWHYLFESFSKKRIK